MADVVRGVPQFDNAISEMNARINKAAKEFVSQGGSEIAARAKESINGSSNDKWHSSAWPIPTSWTNNLRSSIGLDNVKMIGTGVWQSETGPRVAIHARISWSCAATHAARGKTQPRGANTCQLWPAPRVAIHDPEPQSLSPLDVSVGGRTPGRRSLGSKFPQTRQWLVRTPVQPQ